MNRAERWKANSSGEMKINENSEENAVRFQVEWKKKDQWAYPKYQLKPEETLDDFVAIRFEIKAVQGSGSKRFQHSGVQLADGKNVYRMLRFLAPTEEWEIRTVQIPQDLDLSGYNRIRIGMGPIDRQLDYRIRNVRLLFR